MESERQPQHGTQKEAANTNISHEQKDNSFEYYFFPDEKQRMLLGKAIENVIDHVDRVNERGEQKESNDLSVPNVIFLDKSARPLFTIFHEMWSLKHPGTTQPHVSFLNIGREVLAEPTRWQREGEWTFKFDLKIQKELERITKQYTYLKEVNPGSTVVIVDDVENTGSSRNAALVILQEAFPDLKFEYHALVKARPAAVAPENYDKNNPQLFDTQAETLLSLGRQMVYTAPPWKNMGWSGKSPEGVTGVMDDESPIKKREARRKGGEYVEEISLTAIPYRKNEKYSKEQKEVIMEKYERRKQEMELAADGCRKVVSWEPTTIVANPTWETTIILDNLRELKERCNNFLKILSEDTETATQKLGETTPDVSGFATPRRVKKQDEDALQKEIRDFLGFSSDDKIKPGSIADNFRRVSWLVFDPEVGEDFQLHGKEVKIDKMVRDLRLEMKKIADEYWVKKNQ